jgi:hypothetical protein
VRRVARTYGAGVEVTMLADSAVLTVSERTASFSRAPAVPQVIDGDVRSTAAALANGCSVTRFARITRSGLLMS